MKNIQPTYSDSMNSLWHTTPITLENTMSAIKNSYALSVEDYLKGELISDVKHEFIEGNIYAMAGASANHGTITVNLSRKMGNHLEDSPCRIFTSDMKVNVGSNFFYPDVLVDCDFDESESYFTDSPTIIVEVLSQSTSKKDRTIKRFAYLNLPSLQEYVLIEQDFVDIEVVRRKDNWGSMHYFLGDKVTFESIGLTLPVAEIYHRVNNDDMVEFVKDNNEAL